MKTMALATAALLAALTTAHAGFKNSSPEHRVIDHYYTISVPNKPDGWLDTLNVRTEPHGKIVDHFDKENRMSVIQKKGKWWYVQLIACGDERSISGWVNAKYLVEHLGRCLTRPSGSGRATAAPSPWS